MRSPGDTVVLFRGESNFGNIGSMVPALAAGFQDAGFMTKVIDIREAGHEADLSQVAQAGRIAALVCVSGFGLPPAPESQAVDLFNGLDVPVIGVFLDHPFCLRDRIDLPLNNFHACFPAGHAARFCERFIRPEGRYHHLPHGAVARPARDWADRDIPLLLTGSLFLPPDDQRRQWRDHGTDVERRLNDITDIVWQDLSRPLEDAVLDVIGNEVTFDALFPYMKTVDDYVRNAQRLAVVKNLSHLPLCVVGPGWDIYADAMPNVRFTGQKTIDEALAMIDRAKAVLNPFPGYNDSHERVVNAMAGGTAVLSSRSPFYAAAFDAADMFFLPNDAGDLPGAAADLMADDGRLAAMAASGRRKFLDGHTWGHRAGHVARIAGIVP